MRRTSARILAVDLCWNTGDEEAWMPHLSSLPTRVDSEDWLDEDLPAAIRRLAPALPGRLTAVGLPAGYWSVASGAGLDVVDDRRLLARVGGDDENAEELAGVPEISGNALPSLYLTEQSESMNSPVRSF